MRGQAVDTLGVGVTAAGAGDEACVTGWVADGVVVAGVVTAGVVGEGLVTAIPALLVSMSGGLITTRAASESHLGEEISVQLLARSRPDS